MPNFIGVCARQIGQTGWTSVYYPVLSGTPSYAQAWDAVDTINTLEMALYPSQVLSKWIRVSIVDVPRDSKLQDATTPFGTFLDDAVKNEKQLPIDPNLALAINLDSANLNRGIKYMRGLPGSMGDIKFQAGFTPTAEWVTAYNAWRTGLVLKFALMGRSKTGTPPVVKWTPHTITAAEDVASDIELALSIRRTGRPFDLRHGRRLC